MPRNPADRGQAVCAGCGTRYFDESGKRMSSIEPRTGMWPASVTLTAMGMIFGGVLIVFLYSAALISAQGQKDTAHTLE